MTYPAHPIHDRQSGNLRTPTQPTVNRLRTGPMTAAERAEVREDEAREQRKHDAAHDTQTPAGPPQLTPEEYGALSRDERRQARNNGQTNKILGAPTASTTTTR